MNIDYSEERENNVMCEFSKQAPRPTAFEIHRWLRDDLQLTYNELCGIQLDTILNVLFLKLKTPECCDRLVYRDDGVHKFRHLNGTISNVKLTHAGLGVRHVRVFNLPFEVRNDTIVRCLSPFGDVLAITKEKWSDAYYFQVENGIRSVQMVVKKHIPSFVLMNGHRAFITYHGQPQTCSHCGGVGHYRNQCPRRRPAQLPRDDGALPSFASVAATARLPVPTAPLPSTAPGAEAMDTTSSSTVTIPTTDLTRPAVHVVDQDPAAERVDLEQRDAAEPAVPAVESDVTVAPELPPAASSAVAYADVPPVPSADPPVLRSEFSAEPKPRRERYPSRTRRAGHERSVSSSAVLESRRSSLRDRSLSPGSRTQSSFPPVLRKESASVVNRGPGRRGSSRGGDVGLERRCASQGDIVGLGRRTSSSGENVDVELRGSDDRDLERRTARDVDRQDAPNVDLEPRTGRDRDPGLRLSRHADFERRRTPYSRDADVGHRSAPGRHQDMEHRPLGSQGRRSQRSAARNKEDGAAAPSHRDVTVRRLQQFLSQQGDPLAEASMAVDTDPEASLAAQSAKRKAEDNHQRRSRPSSVVSADVDMADSPASGDPTGTAVAVDPMPDWSEPVSDAEGDLR